MKFHAKKWLARWCKGTAGAAVRKAISGRKVFVERPGAPEEIVQPEETSPSPW